MTPKIIKSTGKGQITLPKIWRDQFKTDNFLLQIIIKPIHLDELEATEEVIFDAERDNDGKGVSPEEMIRLIKKIDNE